MGSPQTRLLSYFSRLTYEEVREKIINGTLSINVIPVKKFFKDVDTYLQYAIKHDDKDFVDCLLKKPVNINFNSKNCHPAIYLAVEKKDKDLVKKLLDAKADIDLQSQYEGPIPPNEQFTPLQLAVKLNLEEIADLLINHGADINASSSVIDEQSYKGHPSFIMANHAILPNTMHHFPPLHIAVNNENEEIVDLLIKNMADVNRSPKYNFTSCFHVTSKTPLGIAIKKKNLRLVEKLIEAGADVNISSWDNYWKPLHLAAELNEIKIALLLISSGADVNAISNISMGHNTTTPLHVAVKQNHLQMVQLLINNGALVNFQVNDFLPPILCTVFEADGRSSDMVGCLLESGANIEICSSEGKSTFLHYVASKNDKDLLPFLLKHKLMININTVTSNKKSVLHLVVRGIHESNVTNVLNAGIDINLLDKDGKTAYEIAYENNDYRYKSIMEQHIVKLVLAGIYVNSKNLEYVQGPKYDRLREECRKIVKLMKKIKIPGSNVTYYQLLHNHPNKLAKTLRHLNVYKHEFFFHANEFVEFTHYSRMLWYRKIIVKNRMLLIIEAEFSLYELLRDYELPAILVGIITDYLSNRDLYLLSRR